MTTRAITVRELRDKLATVPADAEVVAYFPGDPSVGIFDGSFLVGSVRSSGTLTLAVSPDVPMTAGSLRDALLTVPGETELDAVDLDFDTDAVAFTVCGGWVESADVDETPCFVLSLTD